MHLGGIYHYELNYIVPRVMAVRNNHAVFNNNLLLLTLRKVLLLVSTFTLFKKQLIINSVGEHKPLSDATVGTIGYHARNRFLYSKLKWVGGTISNFRRIIRAVYFSRKLPKELETTRRIKFQKATVGLWLRKIPQLPSLFLSLIDHHWSLNEAKTVDLKTVQIIESHYALLPAEINLFMSSSLLSTTLLIVLIKEAVVNALTRERNFFNLPAFRARIMRRIARRQLRVINQVKNNTLRFYRLVITPKSKKMTIKNKNPMKIKKIGENTKGQKRRKVNKKNGGITINFKVKDITQKVDNNHVDRKLSYRKRKLSPITYKTSIAKIIPVIAKKKRPALECYFTKLFNNGVKNRVTKLFKSLNDIKNAQLVRKNDRDPKRLWLYLLLLYKYEKKLTHTFLTKIRKELCKSNRNICEKGIVIRKKKLSVKKTRVKKLKTAKMVKNSNSMKTAKTVKIKPYKSVNALKPVKGVKAMKDLENVKTVKKLKNITVTIKTPQKMQKSKTIRLAKNLEKPVENKNKAKSINI